MNKDKILGLSILAVSIASGLAYGWLLFFSHWTMMVLQLTAFTAMAAILTIAAWIGYTLATTPPPKTIEELEKETARREEKGTNPR
ncbi:MAG: transcriptional regulator [Candidatus Bathyarchaeia archaeon]